MTTDDATRARQHLLVQGFELYSAPAAVCTRLVSSSLLDNPLHSWAVVFETGSLRWTSMLTEDDPLRDDFAQAAVRSARPQTPHVLCHTAGARLLLPLQVTDVRGARMRIEAAVAVGMAPPEERLEAYPDEMIEREAIRRGKRKQYPASNI